MLVPLLPGGFVLYTQRSKELSSHAGQVSFPGGKVEPGDDAPLAAALRETREEIGLEPTAFEILGGLDPVPTPSGYLIRPFVGLWRDGGAAPEPRPLTGEVRAIYLAPFDALADEAIHSTRTHEWQGRELLSHEYSLPELVLPDGTRQEAVHVWGATGRITKQLLEGAN